jgi:hypothetical protein
MLVALAPPIRERFGRKLSSISENLLAYKLG